MQRPDLRTFLDRGSVNLTLLERIYGCQVAGALGDSTGIAPFCF